jgi:hypothetical protein
MGRYGGWGIQKVGWALGPRGAGAAWTRCICLVGCVAGGVSLGASDCARVGGGPRYGRSSPMQEGGKGVPAWYGQGPACRRVSGGVVGVLEQGEWVSKVGGVWKREGDV